MRLIKSVDLAVLDVQSIISQLFESEKLLMCLVSTLMSMEIHYSMVLPVSVIVMFAVSVITMGDGSACWGVKLRTSFGHVRMRVCEMSPRSF